MPDRDWTHPPLLRETRDLWRADAEHALRHGKDEDGVPPPVMLRLLATLDKVETERDETVAENEMLHRELTRLIADWQANGNAAELGDQTDMIWFKNAQALLDVLHMTELNPVPTS